MRVLVLLIPAIFIIQIEVNLSLLMPTNEEPISRTLVVIQDIVFKTLQKKAMNAVQVFTNGDSSSMDLSLLVRTFNANCTYQIESHSPVTDDHDDIMALFVNGSMSLRLLTSSLHAVAHPIRKYFIIAYSDCSSSHSFKEIKEIFEEFWNLQIADVVLVCPKLETIEVFTFYPYAKDHCNKVEPILVTSNEDYFPPKNFDFHGCSLSAAFYTEPPHFIDDSISKGIDAELIKYLSKLFNFQVSPEILTKSEASKMLDPESDFFKKVSF